MNNEEIKQERQRRYLELWPTPWDAIEDMSRFGVDQVCLLKDAIRKELPYIVE